MKLHNLLDLSMENHNFHKKQFSPERERGVRRAESLIVNSTSPVEKAILQGIAAYIGDIIRAVPGYIPWSTIGDPCVDQWEGVECNQYGSPTAVDFERWYNGGPNNGFCAMGNKLNGERVSQVHP